MILLLGNVSGSFAQSIQTDQSNNQAIYNQPIDPLQNISPEISKISRSVQNFNNSLKELLEKFTVGKGTQLSDRQQKLLMGFEILNRAEQRIEIIHKFQIELTQK